MKKLFKLVFLFLHRVFNKFLYWGIRVKWRLVVNDLNLKNNPKYESLGVFPTMPSKPPFNYKRKIKALSIDSDNLPTKKYKGKDGTFKSARNPVTICQFGLSEYGFYLSKKDPKHLKNMEIVANWLLLNQDSFGCWREEFDYFCGNVSVWLDKNWICGMAQGEAIAFLCRYHSITKENKFLECAINALQPFNRSIDDNGILSSFNGADIYEEYPTKPDVHVLNGFIYSLFGLYDLWKLHGNNEAERLFENGLISLKQILPYYDGGSWSFYDLGHITAPLRAPNMNYKYHILHIKLLESLYSITEEETFLFYAKKWEQR